jgi:signal transduction histidine kinase
MDLIGVVNNSIEAYKFHIRDEGFEIQTDIPDDTIMIHIDRDAISQSILNLLSNAVKYSEEEKHIKVKISKERNDALISVQDKGIGIPREELKRIFDKFYQVPAGISKEYSGSGLGLTITKQIIEAHGGSIEVESRKGQGCTFNIRLPLSEQKHPI